MTPDELGRMIYGTVCSACHGFEEGEQSRRALVHFAETVKERLTRPQVLELLETGRNQMPSFAPFSTMEKRAVVAFLFDETGATGSP